MRALRSRAYQIFLDDHLDHLETYAFRFMETLDLINSYTLGVRQENDLQCQSCRTRHQSLDCSQIVLQLWSLVERSVMGKSAVIRARVEPEVKEDVESIFSKLGLTVSDAINVFCHQAILKKGFPFEVRVPNAQTKKAMDEADRITKSKISRFKNKEEMFADLGI